MSQPRAQCFLNTIRRSWPLNKATVFAGAVLLAILLASGIDVEAHNSPYSYINLVLEDDRIDGTLTVHVLDAVHDLGLAEPTTLLDIASLEKTRQSLVALVTPRITIMVDGRVAAPEWLRAEILPAHVRIHFRVPAAKPHVLTVRANLFPYDSKHQTFVNIYDGAELRQQLVMTPSVTEKEVYVGDSQTAMAVMATFVPSGIRHILIGPDHILFLIGLLLPGGSWKSLVKIVTAFTIGHSVTLSLAALNVISLPPWVIEPAIALSIVFVGLESLARRERDIRPWLALGFGLVHGFGFASVLREFGLAPRALGWSLFSFNAGVELGQLCIVVLSAIVLTAAHRVQPAMSHQLRRAGAIAIVGAGAWWFVQRLIYA